MLQIFDQIVQTWLGLCCKSNHLKYIFFGVIIVGASVNGVILSLELDRVFMDEDKLRNIVLLGLYIALFVLEYQILVES